MSKILSIKLCKSLLILLLLTGCTEEIQFETEDFESVLIIEALITDEYQFQEIFLSRSYEFGEEGPTAEVGATVELNADNRIIVFNEEEEGKYISSEEFAAELNTDYMLTIRTADSRVYTSVTKRLNPPVEIEAIYAERDEGADGVDGISIFVDNFDESLQSRYFLFRYEETFRIVAPFFVDQDLVRPINVEANDICPIGFAPRNPIKEVCYRTEASATFRIASTTNLNEPRLERFQVRFLRNDDYRISHRYSLLSKQYSISEEVHDYLKAIQTLVSGGSIFSQVQAGYIPTNITSQSNSEELIAGFFEVAGVKEKRLFFNYEDYYPNTPLPPYITDCNFRSPRCVRRDGTPGPLIPLVLSETLVYFKENEGEILDGGPFILMLAPCGDCTKLGSPVPPEFWIN